VLLVVRWLIDSGKIIKDKDGKFSWHSRT